MKEKIQIIGSNISEKGKYNFKYNDINSPEAFDDYDINIIDLSSANYWCWNGSDPNNINIYKDIDTLNKMKEQSKNKIIVICPQNVNYKYYYDGRNFRLNNELKNTEILDKIIHNFQGAETKTTALNFSYNKTFTSINNKDIKSDFIIKNYWGTDAIKVSNSSKKITMGKVGKVYYTTLEINKNEDLIFDLLNEIGFINSDVNEPEWANNINFYNDDELLAKNKELLNRKNEIQKDIDINNQYLLENKKYKSILYENGNNLVDTVNIMLDKMIEYKYEDFVDINKEDFRIEKENIIFIGEIKGINTNVKRANISQTDNHKQDFLDIPENADNNKKVKSILIINRQRELPIDEREKINEDVLSLANRNEVLIILTETLLKLFEYFLQGNISKEEIINIFSSKIGILEQKDFIKI